MPSSDVVLIPDRGTSLPCSLPIGGGHAGFQRGVAEVYGMIVTERVSPVVSVTSAYMVYRKVGSSLAATLRSGLAMNFTSNAPLALVVAVPWAISWVLPWGAGRHQ